MFTFVYLVGILIGATHGDGFDDFFAGKQEYVPPKYFVDNELVLDNFKPVELKVVDNKRMKLKSAAPDPKLLMKIEKAEASTSATSHEPAYLIDNNLSTFYQSVVGDNTPWVKLSWEEDIIVEKVVVSNRWRRDQPRPNRVIQLKIVNRLNNTVVSVSDSNGVKTQCGTVKTVETLTQQGQTYTIQCGGLTANSVTIELDHNSASDVLMNIAEVKVFKTPIEGLLPIANDLVLSRRRSVFDLKSDNILQRNDIDDLDVYTPNEEAPIAATREQRNYTSGQIIYLFVVYAIGFLIISVFTILLYVTVRTLRHSRAQMRATAAAANPAVGGVPQVLPEGPTDEEEAAGSSSSAPQGSNEIVVLEETKL